MVTGFARQSVVRSAPAPTPEIQHGGQIDLENRGARRNTQQAVGQQGPKPGSLLWQTSAAVALREDGRQNRVRVAMWLADPLRIAWVTGRVLAVGSLTNTAARHRVDQRFGERAADQGSAARSPAPAPAATMVAVAPTLER